MKVFSIYFFLSFFFVSGFFVSDLLSNSIEEKEDHELIRNLFRDQVYTTAKKEIQFFLKQYPSSIYLAETYFMYAQIFSLEKKHIQSIEFYTKILKQYPTSSYFEDSLYFLGQLYTDQKNFKVGEEYLKKLLLSFPQTTYRQKAFYVLAKSAFFQQAWSISNDYLKLIENVEILHQKEKIDYEYMRAWITHHTGNKKSAEVLFNALLKKKITVRQKQEIKFQLGKNKFLNQEYQKAKNTFQNIKDTSKDKEIYPKANFWFAESIFKLHELNPKSIKNQEINNAIQAYTENLKISPPLHSDLSRYHRGWLFFALKKYKQAESDFAYLQKKVTLFQKDIDLTLARSFLLEKQKKITEANQMLQSSISFYSDIQEKNQIRVRMIQNFIKMEQCDPSIELIKTIHLETFPQYKNELSTYYAECLFKEKKWKQASEIYQNIAISFKSYPYIYQNYLIALEKQKLWLPLLNIIQRIEKETTIQIDKKTQKKKLIALIQLKKYEPANSALQKITKIDSSVKTDPEFTILNAEILDGLGKENEALLLYRAAFFELKKDPDKKLILGNLLISKYKKIGQYQNMSKIYIDLLPLLEGDPKEETKLMIGDLFYTKLKNRSEAKKWFLKVNTTKNQIIYYKASMMLSNIYIEEKKYQNSIEILEELIQNSLQKKRWFWEPHYKLAQLYQIQEKWKQSIKHYEIALKKVPNHQKEKKDIQAELIKIKKYIQQTSSS